MLIVSIYQAVGFLRTSWDVTKILNPKDYCKSLGLKVKP